MTLQSRLSNKICPEGMSIEEWQVALREEQARQADFTVEHLDDNRIWGDYAVSSGPSRYKVAFRGVRSGRNFCSCLDFRTNGLGTCKHLEAVVLDLRKNIGGYPWADMVFNPPYSSIYVRYKGGREIYMRIGEQYAEEYRLLMNEYFDENGRLPIRNYKYLGEICDRAISISPTFRCYDDVSAFANEVLQKEQWQAELHNAYPSGRIPWIGEQEDPRLEAQERLLYNACSYSNALLVGSKAPTLSLLVARLAEEVYLGEEILNRGFVVLKETTEVAYWQQVFTSIPSLVKYPISIVTEKEFSSLLSTVPMGTNYTFVYIDQAVGLKDWKNRTSIAIKGLKISHLYMRIDSLTSLGSVHISSILQHISPFVIGPFYKFIHTYRPLFPLKDDGSNLPHEMQHCTLILDALYAPHGLDELLPREATKPQSPSDKVKTLIHSLQAVLKDPIALAQCSRMLSNLATKLEKNG